jgi:predicted  nucleic acid-binding Zn-ribbon protein
MFGGHGGGLAGISAAGLLVLAGCGGGGDEAEPLTKSEWIEQADEICAQADEDIEALGNPTTLDEIGELTDEASGISRDALADLRALQPPEEDQETVDQMLDLVEQQIEIGEQIGEAARSGDEAEVRRLAAEAQPLEDQADELGRRYGLVDCADDADR